MANFTTNYELTKPLATELYDIEVQNDNMEKIDVALGNKSEKIAYSTEEVLTGDIWIDGKPIYRKVVTGTISTKNNAIVLNNNNPITDMETVLDIQGTFKILASGATIPLCYNFNTDGGQIQDIVVGVRANGEVYVNSYDTGNVIVIVEYTKTTD